MRGLTPKFMQEWISIIKKDGLKSFVKQKGWKIVALIFAYYLVRDTILYIIIPYLIINNIIECS
ncbi:MAG: hypothetical protein H6627_14180 [Calditrichae bacterium]|nr:hypothetical protein [Calditrichota bacterium]MCB9059709.1 hypothetical protein [Calditrichia bacterium]